MAVKNKQPSIIYGIHPLQAALKNSKRRCHKIVVDKRKHNPGIQSILEICHSNQIKVETLAREVFLKKYGTGSTQGIIGYFSSKEILDIDEMIRQAYQQTATPTLAMIDGIQDPQNMGAIIRSAEVLGLQGIIIPKHRAVPINETVAKCSAGAVETIPITTTANFAKTMEDLKKAGFWTVGVDMAGDQSCGQFKFDMPTALVIGGEEKGIRPLLKKSCDFLVSIPMEGKTNSLNAAAAGAIIFYEVLRQKKSREPAASRRK